MKWLRTRFSTSGELLVGALVSADLALFAVIVVLVALRGR